MSAVDELLLPFDGIDQLSAPSQRARGSTTKIVNHTMDDVDYNSVVLHTSLLTQDFFRMYAQDICFQEWIVSMMVTLISLPVMAIMPLVSPEEMLMRAVLVLAAKASNKPLLNVSEEWNGISSGADVRHILVLLPPTSTRSGYSSAG